METPVTVVILAAGLGTRMKSRRAKVLHRAGGKALVQHVVDTSLELTPPGRIFVVVGHQADEVRQTVLTHGIGFIEQREQRGTGHALMAGRDALANLDGYIVILYGDCPLLRAETLKRLVAATTTSAAAGVLLSALMRDPTGYGRVIRDARGTSPKSSNRKPPRPNNSPSAKATWGSTVIAPASSGNTWMKSAPTIRRASITSPTW